MKTRMRFNSHYLDADRKLRLSVPSTPTPTPNPTNDNNKERLFIHMEFHPNDIPRKYIRAIYDNTCKDVFESVLDIHQFTTAYSRPRNMRDLLTKAKLHQAPGKPISKYYTGELSSI